MADNQMIKVDFQFDLGNVPASTKAFSNYLKSIGVDLKFTKGSTDALASSVGHLATAQAKAAQVGAAAASSVKKSNQQWTNFALILQDLPYGFRGIQNNLPAVIGGLAGMTGPIYLITSAIIALFTALDSGIIKFSSTLSSAEIQQKTFNDVLEKSKDSYAEVKTQVMLLNDQVAEAVGKKDLEKKAVKDYNDTLGDSLGKLNTFKEVQDSLISQGDKYIDYIFKLNMANTAAGKVAEESANMMIASLKKPQDFVGGWDKFWSVQFNMFGNLVDATTGTAKKMYDAGKQNQQEAIKGFGKSAVAAEEVMKIFRKQAQDAKSLLKFGSFDNKKSTSVKTLQDPNIALLEAKKQYYKDDLLMAASFEEEILARKRDLAVRQAELEKKDKAYIQTIKDTYDQLIINSQKNTADKIIEIQRQLGLDEAKEYEKNAKEEEKNNKERITRGEKSYEESLNTVNQFYENKLNLATADKNEQLAILKEEQAYFDILYGFRLIGDQDYANKSAEITKAKVQKEKAIIKESFDSLMQLGNGIMSALGPSLDMLLNKSANIGEVLKSAFNDLLKQLIKVTLAAAIAVALIAIIFPGKLATAGGAGKLFGGLFGQGMGLGKDLFGSNTPEAPKLDTDKPKFANGGIISGPTMGLMGEYPGARSNPEVVAPLDKLKGLIGGNNGGTLEARISGNDLLILMNKAQRNNNLSF